MQQGGKKLNIGFSDLYVVGLILCIGVGEVAHLALLFLGMSLGLVSIICGGFILILLCGWIFIWCKFRNVQEVVKPCHIGLPIAFLMLVLVQLLYLFCMQRVNTPGDITLETVTTFWAQDAVHQVNPLTGAPYGNPLSTRYKILGLSSLYTMICSLTGISPEILISHIVPLFVLGGFYFAYYKLSAFLFKENLGKRYTFLIVASLLLWVTDGATYLDGYGAMQAGYLGTSILNLVLIPWMVAGLFKKDWWQCGLGVLATLCICGTDSHMNNMLYVLSHAGEYFAENKLVVIVPAILLYELFSEKKEWDKKKIIGTAVFFLITPVTALIAYGCVRFLWDMLPAVEKPGKGKFIIGSVAACTILILLGNQGVVQHVSLEETSDRRDYEQVTESLGGQSVMLWGPSRLMQWTRSHQSNIRLPYGKDMWEAESAVYDGDAYSVEMTMAYEWMANVSDFAYQIEVTTDAVVPLPQELVDGLTDSFAIMEKAGADVIVLPSVVYQRIAELVPQKYEVQEIVNYTLLRGND